MNLQEPQSGTTILEVKREAYPLPLPKGRGYSIVRCAKGIPDFFQGIVEDEDVVGHTRRDPHQRISMDSLQ